MAVSFWEVFLGLGEVNPVRGSASRWEVWGPGHTWGWQVEATWIQKSLLLLSGGPLPPWSSPRHRGVHTVSYEVVYVHGKLQPRKSVCGKYEVT